MSKVEEGKCPKCGSSLEYGSAEINDGYVEYECECHCGFSGKEFHDLVFSGFYSKQDNDLISA